MFLMTFNKKTCYSNKNDTITNFQCVTYILIYYYKLVYYKLTKAKSIALKYIRNLKVKKKGYQLYQDRSLLLC